MEEQRGLARIGDMPLVSTSIAQGRLAEIRLFVKQELKQGIDQDFAVIPGTGSKPSLLQPGAEKLLEKLGLGPRYPEIKWGYEDHERGAYMVDVLCQLVYHGNGQVVSECWGSAARDAQEEVDESNAKKVEYAKQDKKPAPEPRVLTMRDKGLARNTCIKMAQKSGLVGATLKAARLAVDFTQDVEDFSGDRQSTTRVSTESAAYCSKHPTEVVTEKTNKKTNERFWSHTLPDGKYCNAGPAKQQEVPSESAFDAEFTELESAVEPEQNNVQKMHNVPTAATEVKQVGAAPTLTKQQVIDRYCARLKQAQALKIDVQALDLQAMTIDQLKKAGIDLLERIALAEKVAATNGVSAG